MQENNENRKKLLSITNLKKYFPIAKSSIFQKEQLYVRANEDLTFDVYEGETIGVVGESGCGKSTLGRVILQLYEQTAGTTVYYGRDRDDVAPKYVENVLKNTQKYINEYHKSVEKAENLVKMCDELGDKATFFQLQDRNLALNASQTALYNVASIIGGFLAIPNYHEGVNKLLEIHNISLAIAKKRRSLQNNQAVIVSYEEKAEEEQDSAKKEKFVNKANALKAIDVNVNNEIEALNAKREVLQNELNTIKEQYADNEDFQKYEKMLDNGIDLARLSYNEMRLLRRDLQIIFQDPYSSLNPRMTIGQIIEEGLVTHHMYKHGTNAVKDYILETMRKCGLQDYMLHRYPHQFSGGQRQRVAIARALAVKPKFVVCDECVSALDVSIQSQIINLLEELKSTDNLTYLFISHDLSVVRYISDKILVMYLGNIVEFASAETLFEDPRHPYTLALLSSIPTTEVDSANKERIILEGNIPSPIFPPTGCKFHTRCYMATEDCKRVPPQLVEVEPGHFVACHNLEKKFDNGKYLFEVPKKTNAQVLDKEETTEEVKVENEEEVLKEAE
ncbi:MAG: ATP-binding cassette domain-containing protein [Bacilli bacterium]|nr:ATP-binding cassette domain-containing protein [Bacilli bacterium]